MIHLYCYVPDTGEIVMTATHQPKSVYEHVYGPIGYAVTEVETDFHEPKPPQTHYIHNGQLTPRPASPIARSGLTLSNVPTGSTLFIDGTAYPAQGTVDLSFPLPGAYTLRVECFPYLDWTDEVTV